MDPGERCDDGNLDAADGCSEGCSVEEHWSCDEGAPSACSCSTYWTGEACDRCVVYADVSSASATTTGESWETAFASLQEALDTAADAGPGCEVWIREGTYAQLDTIAGVGFTLRSHVALYGGFAGGETEREQRDPQAHPTVLSGEIHEDLLYAHHVVVADSVTDVTMDGLIIQKGSAEGGMIDSYGGGVLSVDSDLTLRGVTLLMNAAARGGGICQLGGSLTLDGCLLTANFVLVADASDGAARGGGLYAQDAVLRIQRTWLVGNRSFEPVPAGVSPAGAGAYVSTGCDVEIADSVFSANYISHTSTSPTVGGSALRISSSDARILRTVFVGNTANTAKGALDSSGRDILLENCLFAGNRSYYGGGLVAAKGAILRNCAFIDNEADSSGGGVYLPILSANDTASTEIVNTLFWGNTATMSGPHLYLGQHQSRTLTRCLIPGEQENIGGTPTFILPSGGTPTLSGTFADVSQDATLGLTRFTDDSAAFAPGALIGRILALTYHSSETWVVIKDNTSTEIDVPGLLLATPVSAGDTYRILDFRPANASSACVDAGWGDTDTPTADIDGVARYDAGQSQAHGGGGTPNYVDVGCYEFHP